MGEIVRDCTKAIIYFLETFSIQCPKIACPFEAVNASSGGGRFIRSAHPSLLPYLSKLHLILI